MPVDVTDKVVLAPLHKVLPTELEIVGKGAALIFTATVEVATAPAHFPFTDSVRTTVPLSPTPGV